MTCMGLISWRRPGGLSWLLWVRTVSSALSLGSRRCEAALSQIMCYSRWPSVRSVSLASSQSVPAWRRPATHTASLHVE